MRVLHVWDQAGTGSLMAKYQREAMHYQRSAVIQDQKHDYLGTTKYYNNFLYSKLPFLLHSLTASRLYDIIHLHDSYFMILPLRLLYPKKKIIIHYHGTLIRSNKLGNFRFFLERFVNKILVATPDLLEYKYRTPPLYVPDPIDVKLFHKRTIPQNQRAFTLLKFDQDERKLRRKLIDMGYGFHLEAQGRLRGYSNGIPYKDFDKKLAQYEYFIDIPMYDNKIIKANSCAGLQAMNMGLKVVCHDGTVKDSMPTVHEPYSVVLLLDRIYREIKKG